MAINTKTPIIPVAVIGGFKFKPKTRWYIKPGIINIKVGEPISVENISINEIDGLMEKTHNIFKDLLNE